MSPKGHKQYAYYGKALAEFNKEHVVNIEYIAAANVETGNEFYTLVDNLGSNMNCAGMGNKPMPLRAKPNQERTGNDKVKADWLNEVNKLQSDLDRDNKTFLQLRVKWSGMIKDKTMGVRKEMAQADKQAEDDNFSHMQYISEVIILATLVNPNDFDPSSYADKATNAMQCHISVLTSRSGVSRSLRNSLSSASLQ